MFAQRWFLLFAAEDILEIILQDECIEYSFVKVECLRTTFREGPTIGSRLLLTLKDKHGGLALSWGENDKQSFVLTEQTILLQVIASNIVDDEGPY